MHTKTKSITTTNHMKNKDDLHPGIVQFADENVVLVSNRLNFKFRRLHDVLWSSSPSINAGCRCLLEVEIHVNTARNL